MLAEKDALSSPDDDSLLDETPGGDGHKVPGKLPINLQILQWHTLGRCLRKKGDTRKNLHLLAHRFWGMSFHADWVSPPSGPVKTPGPIAMEASRMQAASARMAIDSRDNQGDDVAGDRDAGGNNAPNPILHAPTQPPAGGGVDAPGGGANPNEGDDDIEDDDPEESSNS